MGKKMKMKNDFDATNAILDYEDGKLDSDGIVKLFQYLIDTDMTWQLQGHYGRTAALLIKHGACHSKKGRK